MSIIVRRFIYGIEMFEASRCNCRSTVSIAYNQYINRLRTKVIVDIAPGESFQIMFRAFNT